MISLSIPSSSENISRSDDNVVKVNEKSLEWINLSFSVRNKRRSFLKACFKRVCTRNQEKVDQKMENVNNESRNVLFNDSNGRRKILCNLNGYINESTLTGILGPSGSGKSTLLNCLFGCSNSKGRTEGEINHFGNQDNMCLISQEDHLFDRLTVKETITFALTVRSSKLARVDVEAKVNKVMSQLWLEVCADTHVLHCSGGQRKRTSIACELICSPKIMILDEPTSGLDSSTALHCIQILKNLTTISQHKISIVLTIHQPSSRVLESFDNIYFLSKFGHNIYFGPPSELVNYLNSLNLSCPKFHNPADFMMEIASSCSINEASSLLDSRRPTMTSSMLAVIGYGKLHQQKTVSEGNCPKFSSSSSWNHFRKICSRQARIILREPLLTSVRLLAHVIVGLSVSLLYGTEAGSSSGCNTLTKGGQPAIIDHQRVYTNENLTLLFFSLFFLTFTALTPTMLTFPSELAIFMKEYHNGYYSTFVYFIATSLVDLPFQIVFPVVYILITYPMTCQPMEYYRFGLFSLISCLVSLVSQSIGLLISTMFSNSLKVIVFLAPVSLTPVFLFSGFFVRFSLSPYYLKPLYHLSYIKYAFEGFLHIIYGYGRCRNLDPYSFITSAVYSLEDTSNRTVFVGEESQSGDIDDEEYSPTLVVDAEESYESSNETSSSWMVHNMMNQTTEQLEKMDAVTEIISTTTMTVMDDPFVKKSAQYNGFNSVNFYSYVMKEFSLDDNNSGDEVFQSALVLLVMVVLLRLLSCIILVLKTRHHKSRRLS